MRGLYRRGKKWYCSIVDPTTKKLIRKPLSEDKQTAILILSNMKKDFDLARAGLAVSVSHVDKSKPARVVIREYMDYLKTQGRSESLFNELDRAWKTIFESKGVKYLEQCTLDLVSAWTRERLMAGTKPQTINQRISILRNMFIWALNTGYILNNPIAGIRQLRPVEKNFRRDLTSEEINALLAAENDPVWKLRWIVYLYTGLRSSAGAALAWEWIDWDNAIITLPSGNNKSKRTHRIPMHKRLFEALRQWQRRSGKIAGPVFPEMHHSTILVRFKKTCQKAGIDLKGVCLHSLRHTVATMIYEASGNNLKAAQEILGHKDIGTTAAYLHVDDATKRAAVAALNFGDAEAGFEERREEFKIAGDL